MDIVGERIMLARKRQGMLQKTLAETVGLTQKHLSEVETGRKHGLKMHAALLIKLADALAVSADYLLGRVPDVGQGRQSAPIRKRARKAAPVA